MWTRTASLALFALFAVTTVGCAGSETASVPVDAGPTPRATLEASVPDTTGASHTLAESLDAGRSVALVFWQPWCGSCRAEAPHARRAFETYAGTMDVMGVVSGPTGPVDEDKVSQAIFDWPITYPTLRDRDLILTKAFDVDATPMIVILNPDGTVAYRADVPPQEWLE